MLQPSRLRVFALLTLFGGFIVPVSPRRQPSTAP